VVALVGLRPMLMAVLEEPPGRSKRRARFLAIVMDQARAVAVVSS
jgi:hypothetical protein